MRTHRKAAGLTQQALADATGLSARGISDLERGARRAPYPETVRRLADSLRLVEPDRAQLLAASRHAGPATSASASFPRHHNLPTLLTNFVGRQPEVTELRRLLLSARLLTLTGAGGVGKTRLALEVAGSMLDAFTDGVWLVGLASIAEPDLVAQSVAAALGIREQSGRSYQATLSDALQQKHLLLVLDNCEHLVDVCAELADTLVRGCPGVHLLATSREALHIPGERAWRVPALAIPDPQSMLQPDELVRFASTQLFCERAQAVESNFAVTPRGAQAVAAICARLEGLPLAIELAAAWVRTLGVEQILERLDDAFGLLVGGSRMAPSRQQTMQATLDWSFGLIAPSEQIVFRRLAVFVGGWSLEAAEEVCSGGGVGPQGVLGLLTRLVDTSLVQVDERDGRARYRLLEPVRQYAEAQLRVSGELEAVRYQHARWFDQFGLRWEPDANSGGPRREVALAALQLERNNLRAALRWCVEQGDAATGFRICRAHWSLWVGQGSFKEGRAWLTELAALPGAADEPLLRAIGQILEATLAFRQGSYARALQLQTEALPVLRQSDEAWPLFVALTDIGWISLHRGDYLTAQTHLDEALAAARAAGNRVNEAIALHNLAWLALVQEDYSAAHALSEASLVVGRAVGDSWIVGISLATFGRVALCQGDLVEARRLAQEALEVQTRIGERNILARSRDLLGLVAMAEGDYTGATSALRDGLQLYEELGDRAGVADTLESIAALAATQTQSERAVQLAGAAVSIRAQIGAALSPMRRAMRDHWLVPLMHAFGTERTRRAQDAGRDMAVEQALELALAVLATPVTRSDLQVDRPPPQVARLSPREREVASLLAHGLTNRQIAQRLVVSERTVGAHVEHILDKLGFASRHQVSAWADEHGLRA